MKDREADGCDTVRKRGGVDIVRELQTQIVVEKP